METMYSRYSSEDTAYAKALAQRFGLLESGGSDFHGKNKPDIALITGRGNLSVPEEIYTRLKEAASELR